MYKGKGIMFDMDNTLLKSNIDFQAMKSEIASFLKNNGLVPNDFVCQPYTASMLIEYVKKKGVSHALFEEMMNIAVHHEVLGMESAGLEPGATELLKDFYAQFVLVIVTNNSYQAAKQALEQTRIIQYFDFIVGREQMEAMKPSPSGYHAAKQHFPHIKEWISVGDSWIDGQASKEAGIPFISYGNISDLMEEKGIQPIAHIDHLLKLRELI
ncbi:HAD-IA family hydrolase [Paenibacillus sp. SYP-B3998]|uniref:HAD-IA family hydrolase n=2 Tax=Paenibacillus sp. SYP-B3998 TaxID=2678564 RepID=A0A6G3ZW77_9BACL|nr:HAD-IA family hydrolase [Paenibacillus sp. SYP-B3998]